MAKREQYPTPQETREGIKVAWRYYASEEDANKCAEAARHNAAIDAAAGYDFGYNAPGSIRPPQPMGAGFYPHLYEVCIP